MKAIAELQEVHARYRLGLVSYEGLIGWGVARLQNNDEGEDLDVVLLAASAAEAESVCLAEAILEKYAPSALNLECIAGREIVLLRRRYLSGEIDIDKLDQIIDMLFVNLDYPNWLVMLARNCEYATDVEPFKEPFEKEFEYIASLWERSSSLEEFLSQYSREVSNSHDLLPANNSLQARRP
jgi:hypothetical protein